MFNKESITIREKWAGELLEMVQKGCKTGDIPAAVLASVLAFMPEMVEELKEAEAYAETGEAHQAAMMENLRDAQARIASLWEENKMLKDELAESNERCEWLESRLKNRELEKNCNTCFYQDVPFDLNPCRNCGNYNHYTFATEKWKEKAERAERLLHAIGELVEGE